MGEVRISQAYARPTIYSRLDPAGLRLEGTSGGSDLVRPGILRRLRVGQYKILL